MVKARNSMLYVQLKLFSEHPVLLKMWRGGPWGLPQTPPRTRRRHLGLQRPDIRIFQRSDLSYRLRPVPPLHTDVLHFPRWGLRSLRMQIHCRFAAGWKGDLRGICRCSSLPGTHTEDSPSLPAENMKDRRVTTEKLEDKFKQKDKNTPNPRRGNLL